MVVSFWIVVGILVLRSIKFAVETVFVIKRFNLFPESMIPNDCT
jgi:hypothetical protein